MREVAFFLCMLLTACTRGGEHLGAASARDNSSAQGTAPSPSNLNARAPLDAAALRTLLSDVYVTPVRPADMMVSHPPGEIFLSDGVYQRILGRTRVEGTFEIESTLVCVQGPDFRQQCRQITPSENNTYLLVDEEDRFTLPVTIRQLG